MRKLLVILLSLCLGFMLLACNDEDRPDLSTSSLSPIQGKITPGSEILGADQAPGDSADQQMLDLINQSRATPLAWSNSLSAYAEAHLANMVANQTLVHSDLANSPLLGRWSILGENVGYGPNVATIFNAYMNSAGHKENILLGDFTHMGSASVIAGSTTWTVQVFGS